MASACQDKFVLAGEKTTSATTHLHTRSRAMVWVGAEREDERLL
jgi:hypothetical protein